MIAIAGATRLRFIFPAGLTAAFDHYCALRQTLNRLPHIHILAQYNQTAFRMCYSTTELGLYRVRLICDIEVLPDRAAGLLRIVPYAGGEAVRSYISFYALEAQADYTSTSVFRPHPDGCEIDYQLNLDAALPVPYGIRFMPTSALNGIARSITHRRIHEIARGFIQQTVAGYRLNQPEVGQE